MILAHGGATFIDALIHDGLIDEYRLVIYRVAIGKGSGLFSALPEPLRLDLIDARTFPEWNRDPRLPTGRGQLVRTLHFGLRVADLDRALAFYSAIGYEVVGKFPRPRWAS